MLDIWYHALTMSHLRLITSIAVLIFTTCVCVEAQQPASTEAHPTLQTAYSLYQQGKLEEALASCKKAIAINPKDYRAHVVLGLIYGAQQKLKNASDAFATAIRLQPKDKEIYLLKAQTDYLRNAHDEALAAAKKAVALDPKYAEAHMIIAALVQHDPKGTDKAIAAYEAALNANPELYAAYDGLGQVLVEAKQYKRAEEVFRKGMAADPKRMAGRFELGRMLVKQGRLAEARELWNGRTSDGDRTFPQFITVLTRAENLKRTTDAAVQNPNDPDALIDLGLAIMDGDSWVVDGRQERALVHFRKALELKPDYPRAQHAIVKAYIQIADTFRKENKNVDAELVKLRKLDPKLADELEQYRKNYRGGLIAEPFKP